MTNSPPQPDDILGMRPAGEGPVGTLGLIRLVLATLRFNFWRLVVITLYVGAVGLGLSLLICCPLIITLQGHPLWLQYLGSPVAAPFLVPLMVGYTYVILLQVLGFKPKAIEVFRPVKSAGLYLNVLAAGGIPYLGGWLLWMLASQPSWPAAETLVPGHPLVAQSLRSLATGTLWIPLLPLAFSGIHVLVARVPFTRALARSARFAIGQWQLFAGFVLLHIGTLLASAGAAPLPKLSTQLSRQAAGTPGGAGGTFFLGIVFLLGLAVCVAANGLVSTLILALFYREFVWREREAQSPPLDSPASAP
jgi:hypothetical protein